MKRARHTLARLCARIGGGDRICGARRGFTLVEVLVSLALFAMAAVVLSAAYVNVLTSHQTLRTRPAQMRALEFARAQLMAESDRQQAEAGGEIPAPDGGELRWRARIEEARIADLFEVTLEFELISPDGTGIEEREQRLFLLRPTWSDPLTRETLQAASRQRHAAREF